MNAFQSFLSGRPFGFITTHDVDELVRLHRLCPVLVRCGGKRFVCAVQDVKAMIAAGETVHVLDVYRFAIRCRVNQVTLAKARDRKARKAERLAKARQERAERRLFDPVGY